MQRVDSLASTTTTGPPASRRPAAAPAARRSAAGAVLGLMFGTAALLATSSIIGPDLMGIVLPVLLVAVSLPILSRQAARDGDRRLFWLLAFALVVKLAGAIVRYVVAVDVYAGRADALSYHSAGINISEQLRSGSLELHRVSVAGSEWTGTGFIELLTGLIYTLIGPSKMGGFFFFSWIGFWGLFLFYRAFTIAMPEGRSRSYAKLVFFLPSLVYWPSSTGKEAWMLFTLGIAAVGAARALSGQTVRGLITAAAGLALGSIVRPHVSALVAVGLAAAYLIRAPRERRPFGPALKIAGLAVVGVGALYLVSYSESFLTSQGFDTEGGVSGLFEQVAGTTGQGGAEFEPPIVDSPAKVPLAIGTVLFRPLPTEAHNTAALAGALEGTFLLLLTLKRFRSVVTAVRGIRRLPYVALAGAYSAGFIFAFSSIGNFGILARERVQLFPFYLVLLCVPAAAKRARRGQPGRDPSRP